MKLAKNRKKQLLDVMRAIKAGPVRRKWIQEQTILGLFIKVTISDFVLNEKFLNFTKNRRLMLGAGPDATH